VALFETFQNPPREYTIIPFWFLNDDLDETELKRQIDDFEAHGVYGFIPHARMGLPESIGFMSDAWLHYVKVCVDYAATKDMVVVLYDEGMYPSGSCAGQVVAADPRYATRCLLRREKGVLAEDEDLVAEDDNYLYVNARSNGHIRGVHSGWDDREPKAPASADLLNPEAMATFHRLVLDRSYEALKEHFGKTVIAVFTDEPDVLGRGHRRGVLPWTWGFEKYLESFLGYDMVPHIPALFDDKHEDHRKYRRDFERAVAKRLEEAYYAPYSAWCEDHGIALTGHPAGADDIGTEKYFHIPGQDIVWRWVEPFNANAVEGEQSTQAKCSVSAQRHYGRKRNANECFGAFGWEFTEDEMWWLSNWLFVRGVNCLYPHAFYYSVRDKRGDERPPDVGPNNVWWDHYKVYADYCRRMSWLMANGKPVCHFAILGTATSLPWRAARVFFEAQRDFNYLDVDTLKSVCAIDGSGIRVQDMTYQALIVDGVDALDPEVLRLLEPMIASGRVIAYLDEVPGGATLAATPEALVTMLDYLVKPDVDVLPRQPNLRYAHVRYPEADIYLFANEGKEVIESHVNVAAQGRQEWWDPRTAEVLPDAKPGQLVLEPYHTRVLCCRRG
jgi:alpha-L-rhamnosidase